MVVAVRLPELLWQAECVGRPELVGLPVVVGGRASRGGSVAAASPVARERGVRTGQPMADALRRCGDAVVLPGQVDRLLDVAAAVHSLAEVRLGTVAWPALGHGVIAVAPSRVPRSHGALDALRRDAASTLGVSVACGLAPSWIGADIAARLVAPAGLLHVVPRYQRRMLAPIGVKWLSGVDRRTAERLERSGVQTLGDLAALDRASLLRLLGRAGPVLARLAKGDDDRQVPRALPLRRVTAFVPAGGDVGSAVAWLIERAGPGRQEVTEARLRRCAATGSQADRVERVGTGPGLSLREVECALLDRVGRAGTADAPTFIALAFGSGPRSAALARPAAHERRTA